MPIFRDGLAIMRRDRTALILISTRCLGLLGLGVLLTALRMFLQLSNYGIDSRSYRQGLLATLKIYG